MPNYKESNIAGTQWQRATRVVLENPYNGVPSINFVEEKAIQIDEDDVITRPCGNLIETFAENKTFPLVDPTTGESLNTNMSYSDLYGIVYSLYMYLAANRDAQA